MSTTKPKARTPRSGGTVDLSRPANLRDAGAPPDPTTSPMLRAGVLYRSDAPLPGDRRPRDLRWPPRTVVDLREPDERGAGPHPLDRPGTAVISLPLISTLQHGDVQAELRSGGLTLAGLYRKLLDGGAAWLPALMRIAARQPGPLLVHCAGGKDRTGVAVAVLLAAAGAPRWHVMADYMRTDHHLPAIQARARHARPHLPVVPDHLAGAPAEAIEAVLACLGPDPAAFLADHQVPDSTVRLWRHRAAPADSTVPARRQARRSV